MPRLPFIESGEAMTPPASNPMRPDSMVNIERMTREAVQGYFNNSLWTPSDTQIRGLEVLVDDTIPDNIAYVMPGPEQFWGQTTPRGGIYANHTTASGGSLTLEDMERAVDVLMPNMRNSQDVTEGGFRNSKDRDYNRVKQNKKPAKQRKVGEYKGHNIIENSNVNEFMAFFLHDKFTSIHIIQYHIKS